MSWHCSRALVEAFSAASCSGGELFAPLSTTPTPDQFYWPDKTTEHSRLSRFGMTCVPLTADRGAALLMWFLAGFPVRTLAQPERATGSTASEVGSGRKWLGLLARYDHDSRSWRTPQCSLVEGLDEFSETWPRWGSMRIGECWERETLEPPTSGNESGFLPTICARDYRYPGKSRLERTGSKAGEVLPQALGGPVNPDWAEWFMGWLIGWTELKPLETAKFQQWQQQHGICSEAA